MRMTILCPDLQSPHAGWQAIDELAYLLAHYFEAELLSLKRQLASWLRAATGHGRNRYAPLQSSGDDVLMVVARAPGDLAIAEAIPRLRQKYSKIHGFVTDSYFRLCCGRTSLRALAKVFE